jgi:hypothetical protein
MYPDKQDDRPLGVLLITTFWILLSLPCFYITSTLHSTSSLGLMLTSGGIVLILVAWGMFTYNKYAYVLSTIIAGLGMFPNAFTVSGLLYTIANGYNYTFILFFFLLFVVFIPLFVYHLKIITLYFPKPS